MSQQGPILLISNASDPALTQAVGALKVFPLVESDWANTAEAISRVQPAAILAHDCAANDAIFKRIARIAETVRPYMPLIALDAAAVLPGNVIPFALSGRDPKHLVGRLNAALRVRTAHATLLRRLSSAAAPRMPDSDPLHDATILLLGRGKSYPAMSVALGEQMSVVGALSIEAAAKHLNARDMDGIVIGEGFSRRVMDAFLTVLTEDARFRNLPVMVAGAAGMAANYDLPNLEISFNEPKALAASATPLIRQHAFEARIQRALKSIDAGGLLDPRTGLLTSEAFTRDFNAAVKDTQARGGGMSVARISFSSAPERTPFDAARILGRLMRRMDFATVEDGDAILIAFAETDSRNAHMIARRLTSVLKHTMRSANTAQRLEPEVAIAGLLPDDTSASLLAKLNQDKQRAAS